MSQRAVRYYQNTKKTYENGRENIYILETLLIRDRMGKLSIIHNYIIGFLHGTILYVIKINLYVS
jgi:hypothetical protein